MDIATATIDDIEQQLHVCGLYEPVSVAGAHIVRWEEWSSPRQRSSHPSLPLHHAVGEGARAKLGREGATWEPE